MSLGSPLDVRSLQDRVYTEIRVAMRKGVFPAGQPLTIRALAARFGTSEMPVREAIKRLVAEKALVQQSDRTFRVPVVTFESSGEVLPIRAMMEGLATELASKVADKPLINALTEANDRMVAALSRADVTGILENNQAFHFLIYEKCGNNLLLEIIDMLWVRSGPYLAALATERRGINAFFDAANSHRRILKALETRDGPAAAQALREDIETTAHWFWTRSRANEEVEQAEVATIDQVEDRPPATETPRRRKARRSAA